MKTSETHQMVSRSLLIECQNMIKELKLELEHSMKLNQEKDNLISMLTEEKQFYLQQNRKFDQKTYGKLKEQISWNSSLIQGLKQHNKELSEKNQFLIEENENLLGEIQNRDLSIRQMSQELEAIKSEKKQLEAEWSQTLICVRKKIFQLNSQKQQKSLPKEENKAKNLMKGRFLPKQQRGNSVKQQRVNKVESILQEIDNKLLNYEFMQMIKANWGGKKTKVLKKDNFDNKQNLQFNSQVVFDKSMEKAQENILKVSELEIGL